MNVLLIEDDENKGVQIGNFLREAYPAAKVKLARSLQSGVRHIRAESVDLIILDMTLPHYDASPEEPGGGDTHSFGGREFLKQMDRFDIEVPVVVVTQFETFGKAPNEMGLPELDAKLRSDHRAVYRGAVYYHASIHGWREQLELLIRTALTGYGPEGGNA